MKVFLSDASSCNFWATRTLIMYNCSSCHYYDQPWSHWNSNYKGFIQPQTTMGNWRSSKGLVVQISSKVLGETGLCFKTFISWQLPCFSSLSKNGHYDRNSDLTVETRAYMKEGANTSGRVLPFPVRHSGCRTYRQSLISGIYFPPQIQSPPSRS